MNKKISLITGASRGIGAEFAKVAAQKEIHPILLARNSSDLEKIYDEIETNGGSSTIMPCDLVNLEQILQIAQNILDKFNRLDYLICNAATMNILQPISNQNIKEWLTIFNINLHANFLLLRTLHTLLISSKATIIGVIDQQIKQNNAYWCPYSLTKNAFQCMLETYQKENIDQIKVKFFDPGKTNTQLHKKAFPESNEKNPVDLQEKIKQLF